MVVKDKIKALREALEQHNYNYYVLSAPTISDREFDEMMKELQILEEAHPEYADPHSPTQRVGSDLSKEFEQVVHKYPMKIYRRYSSLLLCRVKTCMGRWEVVGWG